MISFLKKSVVLLLVMSGLYSLHASASYIPNHKDISLKKYITTQVIDANWKSWTDDNKKQIKQRMFDATNTITDDRLIRFTYEMMSYRDLKRAGDPESLTDEETETGQADDLVKKKEEKKIEKDIPIKNVVVSPNDIGSLIVRNGPGKEFKKIDSLKTGETVSVYEEKNEYFRIYIDSTVGWIAVEYVHLEGTDAPTHHLSKPAPSVALSSSKKDFLERYRPLVDKPNLELSDLCKKYYPQIDAVAREYDFPTELIISTWYREHTCIFKNPSNGRGNFQITSNRYQPGPISVSDLEKQVVDFINFSKKKWKYYDAIQVFGPEPVSITYDAYDLTSIRKQSILYNGIVGELKTNVYANQNFNGVKVGGRDGIVAHLLKVLKWRSEVE